MNTTKLSLVPFQQASLCLDCDMITAAHTHCSVCGSVALLNLARALNGRGYPRPLPGTLTATGISAHRDFETLGVPGTLPQHSVRFAAGRARSLEVSSDLETDTRHTDWRPLRGAADFLHRVVTSAIVSILVLGASIRLHV
jgi:hypothetical protein